MTIDTALVFTHERQLPAAPPAAGRLEAAAAQLAAAVPGGCVELFSAHPQHARLTLFGDGEPPLTIVEARSQDAAALQRAMDDPQLGAALLAAGDGDGGGGSSSSGKGNGNGNGGSASASGSGSGSGAISGWRAGLFRVEREPVPAPDDAAPLALVVHYHGPVDDAAAFAAHYVAQHPPLLARLPGVCEVLCYVPLGAAPAGLPRDPTVIRNEVRFASMDALLAALRSPLLAELRADTRSFPRFGRSTHFPMLRRRFAPAR